MPEASYTPTDNNNSAAAAGINSPGLSAATLKPKQRSIKDATQAWNVVAATEKANSDRNKKNARITAKVNSEKPVPQGTLEAEGLGWKSNFTTKPLTTLINKVAPRLTMAIDSLRYFTNSALPETAPNAAHKTEQFRKEITDTIRARPEWKDLIAEIAQENALFGYTSAFRTSEYRYMLRHFRQDSFFIPTGTRHNVKSAQIVVLKENQLPHEVFELIEDKQAAKDAGWDIANTVESINNAMPDLIRSKASNYERVYEDLVRESTAGNSFVDGAKVVVLYHLYATEIDGQVSHYILDGKSQKLLFERHDQFKDMAEAGAFYSFEHGNGTMHGSKGIGREVYAMAAVLDRSRNEVVDRLQLAGKLVIQGDVKQLQRFKMNVVGNAILIGTGYQVLERQIESEVDSFFTLDNYMSTLLDQMVGNITPRQLEGDRVTKAQVDLVAAREEEAKDTKIGRFLTQFSAMISTMQRIMCSKQCIDEDAQEMRKRLLKIMNEDELKTLAEQPSANVVKDYSDFERQQIIIIATENRGNPLYNQKELERRKVTAQLGAEFAEAVLLPDNDPTVIAEQTRLQQMELLLLSSTGMDVPVSPRDAHDVHLQLVKQAVDGALVALADDPAQLPMVQAMVNHGKNHIAAGVAANGQANYTTYAAYFSEIEKRLKAFEAHEAAVEKAANSGADITSTANAGATAAMEAVPAPVSQPAQ